MARSSWKQTEEPRENREYCDCLVLSQGGVPIYVVHQPPVDVTVQHIDRSISAAASCRTTASLRHEAARVCSGGGWCSAAVHLGRGLQHGARLRQSTVANAVVMLALLICDGLAIAITSSNDCAQRWPKPV